MKMHLPDRDAHLDLTAAGSLPLPSFIGRPVHTPNCPIGALDDALMAGGERRLCLRPALTPNKVPARLRATTALDFAAYCELMGRCA